jgi:SEC-C motif
MSDKDGPNDRCVCGSGKKYKDCCGAPKDERVQLRPKDLKVVESTPGLADALAGSLDPSYQEYWVATVSGRNTKAAEDRVAAIPEDKRYLTKVLDSLDNAFADFDSETVKLDLPHMRQRKPEAIKTYLEIRLRQFRLLLDAVADHVDEKYAKVKGHS